MKRQRSERIERVPCSDLRKCVAEGKGKQVQISLWFTPEESKLLLQWIDDQGLESVTQGVRLLVSGALSTFPEWHVPQGASYMAVLEARRYMQHEVVNALREIVQRYEESINAGRPLNFSGSNRSEKENE